MRGRYKKTIKKFLIIIFFIVFLAFVKSLTQYNSKSKNHVNLFGHFHGL
jgi:hypothetical protein